jgi:Putative Actinobacterial Holin-X, holin superfamily III
MMADLSNRSAGSAADPSVAELIGGLIGDAQTLVRREIDLAKAEVGHEIDKAKQGAISLGIGIGVAALGGILLTLMLVHLIHEVGGLALWLSYLIIGAVFGIIGAVLLAQGAKRMKQIDPLPRETIESVKKDVQWISEQTSSDRT